jgi:hypothetical protein
MSMVTELFGPEILNADLGEVKRQIRMLPPAQKERRSYLLHDWASITGMQLTQQDFRDVEGEEQ